MGKSSTIAGGFLGLFDSETKETGMSVETLIAGLERFQGKAVAYRYEKNADWTVGYLSNRVQDTSDGSYGYVVFINKRKESLSRASLFKHLSSFEIREATPQEVAEMKTAA